MPMNRALYPADWEAIARRVKEAADWSCAECGRQCRKPGEMFDTHRRTLTVAHVNHRPADCRAENLRALCAGCHLRYDAPEKARRRAARRTTAGGGIGGIPPCPVCPALRATLAWAEHKLRRLLALSPALDRHDRATVRAVAEALSARNSRHKTFTNHNGKERVACTRKGRPAGRRRS